MDASQSARELARALSRRLVDAAPGRRTLPVEAPFTGEPIGEIPLPTREDVFSAVERARVAQRRWATVTVADRSEFLLRFHDWYSTEAIKSWTSCSSRAARRGGMRSRKSSM
jgi:acyl-CoA reductase-like NAD-dependent aldehyde dehydrogenase